jgi:aspartate/methionine/tyrosine aminotransferase
LPTGTQAAGLTAEQASRRLSSRARVAATPMTGRGPSGSRYLRPIFASEPAERPHDLRARFDTAFGRDPG